MRHFSSAEPLDLPYLTERLERLFPGQLQAHFLAGDEDSILLLVTRSRDDKINGGDQAGDQSDDATAEDRGGPAAGPQADHARHARPRHLHLRRHRVSSSRKHDPLLQRTLKFLREGRR